MEIGFHFNVEDLFMVILQASTIVSTIVIFEIIVGIFANGLTFHECEHKRVLLVSIPLLVVSALILEFIFHV